MPENDPADLAERQLHAPAGANGNRAHPRPDPDAPQAWPGGELELRERITVLELDHAALRRLATITAVAIVALMLLYVSRDLITRAAAES